MSNDYYNPSGAPATSSQGSSATVRSELALIAAGFAKMPVLSGNASKIVAVNSGATGLESVTVTGTGNIVRATGPTLVAPVLGAATATSINGVAISGTGATITLTSGKTLSVSNTLTLAGTDGSTLNIGAGGTLGTAAFATIANYAPLAGAAFTGAVSVTGAALTANGGGALTGTWSSLGTVTTMDLNGGTIDGTVIGGASAAAGTFTSLNATSGGALTGTWSSLGTVTTVDINGGTIDGSVIGGASPAAGTFTTVNDSKGELRKLPVNAQTNAYVLLASDHGKIVSNTTGGWTINTSVLSPGEAVTLFNNSSSNQTLTAGGGVTLRLGGSASTGNRTIAQYGLATLVCVATDTFVITGSVT